MNKQNQPLRIASGAFVTGLLLVSGVAGAQTVAVPGVSVGAGARVESGTAAVPVGVGGRTDASGVALPATGGVVSNTTGTVGGTLHNVTGAATSGTAAVRQQGAGALRQGAMGSGARVYGNAQGSGAIGFQK